MNRLSIALVLGVGCGNKDSGDVTGDEPTEVDADTDADADSDTDADTDTDTDTDVPAAACSAEALAGRFGFVAEGTRGGTPFVAGGTIALAGDGTWTADGNESLDGAVAPVSRGSGTWVVDEEACTAVALDDAGDPAFDLTFVRDGREFRYLHTIPGDVVTGRAVVAAEQCDDANVAGDYVYALNAIVYLEAIVGFPLGPSPFAGAGVVGVGGDGTLSLVDDASIGGVIFPRSYDGTLAIDADCVGDGVIDLPPTAPTSIDPVHVEVVFLDDRAEASVIQTDAGTFIAGTALRRDPAVVCEPATYEGRFGFVARGTVDGDPYVAGGLLAIDGAGNVVVDGTESLDGTVRDAAPAAGVLGAFDADCRADLTDGGDAWLAITAIDADRFSFVRTIDGQVVTGLAERMAEGCSLASVAGSYGYGIGAVVYLDVPGFPVGASPFAGAGRVDVAADGTVALVDTASIAGIVIDRSYDGEVTVAGDCTGEALVNLPPQAPTSTNPVNVDLYWVGDGSRALLVQKDPGTFIAGSTVRRDLVP